MGQDFKTREHGPRGNALEPMAKETFEAEGKQFTFELFENARGRVLRITEFTKGRRNCIMIPATGLPDATECLRRITEYSNKTE